MASLLFFSATLLLNACGGEEAGHFSGETMGTSYHITVVSEPGRPLPEDLAESIQQWLDEVNQHMSTYLADSELSQLNRGPVGEWLSISPMMAEVLLTAQTVAEQSGGAFDITVGPLVDLWGFGPPDTNDQVPDGEKLARVQARVGYTHLQVRTDPPAIKKTSDIQMDLSAIAKGFAGDYVGRQLLALGFANHLVEVGGDLLATGHNPAGEAWRIGVEQPSFERQGVQQAVRIKDRAIATSGGYRNFFQQGGQSYSHILDPRVGRPVPNTVASVTAIADSAALADAWATAYSVMGSAESLAMAERRDMAVYLIVRGDQGFATRHSTAFAAYMDSE